MSKERRSTNAQIIPITAQPLPSSLGFRNSFVICHSQRSTSIGSTLRSEFLHMNASATGAEDHWFAAAIDWAFEMVASDFAADRYRQVAGHPAAGRGGVKIERGILREMHGNPAAGCSQFHFIGQWRGKPGGEGAAGSCTLDLAGNVCESDAGTTALDLNA